LQLKSKILDLKSINQLKRGAIAEIGKSTFSPGGSTLYRSDKEKLAAAQNYVRMDRKSLKKHREDTSLPKITNLRNKAPPNKNAYLHAEHQHQLPPNLHEQSHFSPTSNGTNHYEQFNSYGARYKELGSRRSTKSKLSKKIDLEKEIQSNTKMEMRFCADGK